MYNTSILLTTYNREEDCKKCLLNLRLKAPVSTEIILLDEWHLPTKTLDVFCIQNNIKYLWTGRQKNLEVKWRVPGYALNIGAKLAKNPYLIIGCAEIYINEPSIITSMAKTKCISAPTIYDQNQAGELVSTLNSKLPFFLGIPKQSYIDIGGYDEDFTGYCFDDNDFSDRIFSILPFEPVSETAIHLWNKRGVENRGDPKLTQDSWEYNRFLYESRKGMLKRNIGRVWGVL